MKKIEKVNKYCISMTLVRAFLLWAFLLFWWYCRRENVDFKKRSSSSYSLLFCNLIFISIFLFLFVILRYVWWFFIKTKDFIEVQSFVKSIGKCQKNPYIINQNHIFFKNLLWSHFWIELNKLYTKTFGIVYILFVYLLIMFIWAVFICT
jgi:hypothetical protein